MKVTVQKIIDCGVVAILRANSSAELLEVAKALHAGNVTPIEVTMTTPNALEVVRQVKSELGDRVVMGVGTVLDPETARAAILAGAEYIVSPVVNEATIRLCRRYGIPVMPGAFTPTEVLRAWDSGADVVKIFPTSSVGPEYIKDLKGPFPQIPMIPTGGVNVDTAGAFIKAGACAVGAGSSLVDKKAVKERKWEVITDVAERMVAAVQAARNG
ncbi:MAG: bifunctional 4-hydroxy-2-oxoglutarate aldolase/2-dehydro-3-deoxy-phosphogluconate aldolase [Armatimonadetes bacterium]|nr:bifunctional 4-hydroxy-2-oxoglutarate aldolase/2-dehydro-3-deoxy-phosphogluconate aldolase [Armatimonadota bacterium]